MVVLSRNSQNMNKTNILPSSYVSIFQEGAEEALYVMMPSNVDSYMVSIDAYLISAIGIANDL